MVTLRVDQLPLIELRVELAVPLNFNVSDDNPLPHQPDPIMNEVSVQRGGFNPMVISVDAGTLITWTSKDDITESVTSSTGLFDGIISSYGSYSYQFSTPGTYPYYSRVNPNLTGKVIVN